MSNPHPLRSAAARGGRAKTPSKLAALSALHAARRGKRVNASPARERQTILAELAGAVREPVRGVRSIREAARHVGVNPTTVCRWLSGTDWPPASALRAIRTWLKSVK